MHIHAYLFLLIIVLTPDVRLVSTDNRPYSGQIEVFFNNEWGQVCLQRNSVTLSVVCAQIGYGPGGTVSSTQSTTTSRNPRIWLSFSISCVGNEGTLFDCLSSYDVTRVGKLSYGYCIDGVATVTCLTCKLCA